MRSRVELFEQIRRDRRGEQFSIRELAERHGVHRRTVRQALASALPPPRKAYPARPRPAIDAWAAVIDAWLVADHDVPRKQRHTARRTLHTGTDLLTDTQQQRLESLFAGDEHVEVEATWGIYQRMIAAYREPDRARARELMRQLIDSVSSGVPGALKEVITLGRTLQKRAVDVLAYFDRPGTSNGPTEAINGRLEHLRGSALGFRNLTNYIARSLLETGGFRPQLHPKL